MEFRAIARQRQLTRISMSDHASASRVYRGVRHARVRCASERYVHTGWFSLAELVHTKKKQKKMFSRVVLLGREVGANTVT
jgi:hypothetical protein